MVDRAALTHEHNSIGSLRPTQGFPLWNGATFMVAVTAALPTPELGRVELGLLGAQRQMGCAPDNFHGVVATPGLLALGEGLATCQEPITAMMVEGEPSPPSDRTLATAGDGEGLLSWPTV
jgi:hypothetical protein